MAGPGLRWPGGVSGPWPHRGCGSWRVCGGAASLVHVLWRPTLAWRASGGQRRRLVLAATGPDVQPPAAPRATAPIRGHRCGRR
jgi:hypothetical protein